jgi:hypothetical protein
MDEPDEITNIRHIPNPKPTNFKIYKNINCGGLLATDMVNV